MLATINGVQIGFDDYGQGPVVLFIHDYLLDRRMWQAQVEPLVEAGFRVILADLRGFGESELGQGALEIQHYAADIIGLLDFLGIGRAAVCGLSFGGSVLLELMANYPQRLSGACLVTSRAVADDIHEHARRGEIRAALEKGQFETVKNELFETLFSGHNESLPDTLRLAVRQLMEVLQSQTLMAAMQAIGRRKDYTFVLKQLNIPSLLIGAEHDPITHHRHTDLLASQLPDCYGAVKLNAGHLVNMENTPAFNRTLLDFLRKLAPRKQRSTLMPLSSAV